MGGLCLKLKSEHVVMDGSSEFDGPFWKTFQLTSKH